MSNSCPNCGYCPHCKRARPYHTQPYWQYIPPSYAPPQWTITSPNTSGTIIGTTTVSSTS